MVTLSNWTPLFEWYIARLVVKVDTENACVVLRLDYVIKCTNICVSTINKAGRVYVIT